MTRSPIRRRDFLKTSALFSIIPAAALGRNGAVAASERVTVGCIGVGSRGESVLKGFLLEPAAQVVAVCDVKSNVLARKQELVNNHYNSDGCAAYADFREMTARDDIDLCMVATCDHWHVLAALDAVRNGKDVYVEKPLGLTLEEDLALRRELKARKRLFQFGTQQRSDPKFQFARHLVRSGKIGELREIRAWAPGSIEAGDPAPAPVPEWLDYEMWTGPAPFSPYTEKRCSNELWWFISDYALGFIAGWGIHPVDIAVWGAEDHFKGVWSIVGIGKFPQSGICDTAMHWDVTAQLESGVMVRFTGDPCPVEWQERYQEQSGHGTAFEGEEGWVYVRRGKIDAHPKSLLDLEKDFPVGSDEYQGSTNAHASNFVHAVKNREESASPIDSSVVGDAFCHVSDIAIREGRELKFDLTNEGFINDERADWRLSRAMRAPWRLEG